MGLYGNTPRDVENDIIAVVNAAIKNGDIDLTGASTAGTVAAGTVVPAPEPDTKAKGKK